MITGIVRTKQTEAPVRTRRRLGEYRKKETTSVIPVISQMARKAERYAALSFRFLSYVLFKRMWDDVTDHGKDSDLFSEVNGKAEA